jgi:hypothetical protein
MWLKVDDEFPSHPKVLAAARILDAAEPRRRCGYGRAASVWLSGYAYTAKYLTDGFIPYSHITGIDDPNPVAVAQALEAAHLWEAAEGGWVMHDYHAYNPRADEVLAKREADRIRKENKRRAGLGLPPISAEPVKADRPRGSALESLGNPIGFRADSSRIPELRARAGAGAPGCVPSRPVPSDQEITYTGPVGPGFSTGVEK